MKAIFESIKQRIIAKTAINDVRMFANQLQNMETGSDTLFLPSVLVEFLDVAYGFKNDQYQYGNALLRIHVVTEDYNSSPETAFSLREDVDRCLNRYSDALNFHPLERSGETVDGNYSNVYVYGISYNLNFVHYFTPEIPDDVAYVQADLDITTSVNFLNGK